MATKPDATYTYDDLRSFPEDHLRRELIEGELIVTAAPSVRHQRVVAMLTAHLFTYHLDHGGEVLPAPTDVLFTDRDVVEPDVIFVREENRDRLEERFVRSAPDIVIEVSSPSTRHLEIVRKRELYERFAVPEYWYIDLEAERVEVYRLQGGGYGTPVFLVRDDVLESPILPSFSVSVDEILGESPA